MTVPTRSFRARSTLAIRLDGWIERGRKWIEEHPDHFRWAVTLLSVSLLLLAARRWALTIEDPVPCKAEEGGNGLCESPPAFIQQAQDILALVGITAAVVAALLSLYQAYRNQQVPAIKIASAALVGAGVIWLLLGWCGGRRLLDVAVVFGLAALLAGVYVLVAFLLGLRRTESGSVRTFRMALLLAVPTGVATALIFLHIVCEVIRS